MSDSSLAGSISARRLERRQSRADRRLTGAPSSDLHALLTELDEPLLKVLRAGDIRLVRSAWLCKQPDGFILQRRQELEGLGKPGHQSPLLSPEEAVNLVKRGDRSVGALTHRWLTARHPVSP